MRAFCVETRSHAEVKMCAKLIRSTLHPVSVAFAEG